MQMYAQVLEIYSTNGFRQMRSCETQLLLTIDDLPKNLNNNLQTDVLFQTLPKLLTWLIIPVYFTNSTIQYGIHGSLLSWLENFLTRRIQHVTVEGHYSSTTNITTGVPQRQHCPGTFTVFYVIINDLPVSIKSNQQQSILCVKVDTCLLKAYNQFYASAVGVWLRFYVMFAGFALRCSAQNNQLLLQCIHAVVGTAISYQIIILSYSTVVLYIGIMKVWGCWPEIITPKPA